MTELKLNKHLGGERPRDGPGGWASGSSGPGSGSPGSPLAAPAGPRCLQRGVSAHPNVHIPPKNGRQGASLGLLKGLTPFSSGEFFFSCLFGQKLTLPSIPGGRRKKRTSAQLSSLNPLKLRVSANKQSCRPPEGHSRPGHTPPEPRCTLPVPSILVLRLRSFTFSPSEKGFAAFERAEQQIGRASSAESVRLGPGFSVSPPGGRVKRGCFAEGGTSVPRWYRGAFGRQFVRPRKMRGRAKLGLLRA